MAIFGGLTLGAGDPDILGLRRLNATSPFQIVPTVTKPKPVINAVADSLTSQVEPEPLAIPSLAGENASTFATPQQELVQEPELAQTSLQPTNLATTGVVAPTSLATTATPDLLESSILPSIGDWAEIGTAGTGFDWSGFTYNPITGVKRPVTQSTNQFMNASAPAGNMTYADYLSQVQPYQQTYKPAHVDFATQIGMAQARPQTSVNALRPLGNYTPFTYSDTNVQNAVNELDKALEKALYTTSYVNTGTGMGSTGVASMGNFQTQKTLNRKKLDSDLTPFLKEVQVGRAGVSMLDAINDKDRDRILAQVSAKTGIPVDELNKKYSDYHYANKVFYDPSGANYADLMKSQAAEDVRAGIAKWSGAEKEIKKANDLLSRETVAKEFTGQNFGVTEQAPVKEIKDEKGNTYYAVYNKGTGTQFVALTKDAADKIAAGTTDLAFDKDSGAFYGKKDAGEYLDAAYYFLNKPKEYIGKGAAKQNVTRINKMMTLDDFLPAGVTMRTATPEQIADARSALQGQKELMGTWVNPSTLAKDATKVHTANKFNLTEDSAPIKKKGSYFFLNDETGKVNSTKNRALAEWAADDVANDTPIKIKKDYFFIDKDTGEIRSTRNQFIAQGESSMKGFTEARNWENFLPSGVTAKNATPEQELKAKTDFTAQQRELSKLLGKGSVYNMFASEKLPIPKDFAYAPENITRDFNTLVNMGINPTKIDKNLTPQNVYKSSLYYDKPDSGGFGGFVTSFIVPALSIAYPGLAPILQGLSGAYQLSQGDVLGGLMSIAGGSGLLDKVFGGKSALSGVKSGMTDVLTNKFGFSGPTAKKLVDAGLWAGGNAAAAALTDRNVLEALATGAGVSYLSSSINNGLKTTIPNDNVRNFITQRLTSSLMTALEGGKINLDEIMASGFGTGLFTDMAKKSQSGLKR